MFDSESADTGSLPWCLCDEQWSTQMALASGFIGLGDCLADQSTMMYVSNSIVSFLTGRLFKQSDWYVALSIHPDVVCDLPIPRESY